MRLLLVGAFAYPHDQGSQVYFQEQALALRAAGVEVEVLCYGPGPAGALARPAAHPLTDLPFHSLPAWAVPASRRSGPQAAKLFADLWLAAALRRLVAARRDPFRLGESAPGRSDETTGAASENSSKLASWAAAKRVSSASSCPERPLPSPGSNATRGAGRPFDAILAHNAEAALLALHALPRGRPPVVYCAHTLLENELPEYFKSPNSNLFLSQFPGPGSGGALPADAPRRSGADAATAPDRRKPGRSSVAMTQSAIARLGRVIDRHIAARVDGWIALTQSTSRVMSASGTAPGRLIQPPVPALHDAEQISVAGSPTRKWTRPVAANVARSHGLQPGGYFLYTGNLDPYQDLALLEAVARARHRWDRAAGERGCGAAPGARVDRVPGSGSAKEPLPIVVATHDERAAAFAARTAPTAGAGDGLVVCRVRSASEANALLAGARATIVPRRSLGGFPIKLANSLAAGIPVIALHAEEWGLADERDALIGDLADPVASIARVLERLELDPALAARLGEGARATHHRQHDPARVAAQTLALLASLPKRSGSRDGRIESRADREPSG